MSQENVTQQASFLENKFRREGLEKVHAQILSDHWSCGNDKLGKDFIEHTVKPLYGEEIASSILQSYDLACAIQRENSFPDKIWVECFAVLGEPVIQENQGQWKRIPPYTGKEFLQANVIEAHPYKEALLEFLQLGINIDAANVLAWGNKNLDLIGDDINDPVVLAASEVFEKYERANYWASFEEKFENLGKLRLVTRPYSPVRDKRMSRAVGCIVLLIALGMTAGAVAGLMWPICKTLPSHTQPYK